MPGQYDRSVLSLVLNDLATVETTAVRFCKISVTICEILSLKSLWRNLMMRISCQANLIQPLKMCKRSIKNAKGQKKVFQEKIRRKRESSEHIIHIFCKSGQLDVTV